MILEKKQIRENFMRIFVGFEYFMEEKLPTSALVNRKWI
jgi:hypothetical protein